MKYFLTLLLIVSLYVLSACESDPGKELFEDRSFANSTKKVACKYCHAGGSKFNGTATKTEFEIDGKVYSSIEEVINKVMISEFTKGQPIDENSKEMKDLIKYIKKIAK